MEKLPPETSGIYDIKTLSPQTKIRYVFEIFDLGKDKDANEKRKNKFISLMGSYYKSYIKSELKISSTKGGKDYETGRATLHNEIMDILQKASLSIGLTSEQRDVVTYLSENRDEVTKIISSYFAGYDTSDSKNYSELQMARRGGGMFTSPPGKEDD